MLMILVMNDGHGQAQVQSLNMSQFLHSTRVTGVSVCSMEGEGVNDLRDDNSFYYKGESTSTIILMWKMAFRRVDDHIIISGHPKNPRGLLSYVQYLVLLITIIITMIIT